jgi:hypothetical protein
MDAIKIVMMYLSVAMVVFAGERISTGPSMWEKNDQDGPLWKVTLMAMAWPVSVPVRLIMELVGS